MFEVSHQRLFCCGMLFSYSLGPISVDKRTVVFRIDSSVTRDSVSRICSASASYWARDCLQNLYGSGHAVRDLFTGSRVAFQFQCRPRVLTMSAPHNSLFCHGVFVLHVY